MRGTVTLIPIDENIPNEVHIFESKQQVSLIVRGAENRSGKLPQRPKIKECIVTFDIIPPSGKWDHLNDPWQPPVTKGVSPAERKDKLDQMIQIYNSL